jgi:purine-binding chemotaxis protein CheW
MSDSTSQVECEKPAVAEKGGKYLTFALGDEEYGLEILKVREIIGYMDITTVPQMPHFVKGVINLRGQIIPVIELRTRFGLQAVEVTKETCIIVVEVCRDRCKYNYGIVVDRVLEVLEIVGENIEETPQFGSSVNTDFLLGMGKVGESIKILLDIDKILESDDFSVVMKNCDAASVMSEK